MFVCLTNEFGKITYRHRNQTELHYIITDLILLDKHHYVDSRAHESQELRSQHLD